MRREDGPQASALGAATGARTTLSVSKGGRRERQGIGKPLLRSNLSASAVFSACCYKRLQLRSLTFIPQILIQDCSVPGGMPDAGAAG